MTNRRRRDESIARHEHWLTTEGLNVPPMPWRIGDGPERGRIADDVSTAARYAVRASTMNGTAPDFDPDAMVQNFVVAMLGYWTADGYSDDDWANPSFEPSDVARIPALGSWRCFHCGEVFTNDRAARQHFGVNELATPGCQIKGHEHGLLGIVRDQEAELARHRGENTEFIRAMMHMRSDHADALRRAEEDAYGRGVRDLKAIAEKQFGAEVVV